MSDANAQGSEVARLLRQIRDEYTSAQRGLTGLAYGSSQHKIITIDFGEYREVSSGTASSCG
jgi:hypothetical protein